MCTDYDSCVQAFNTDMIWHLDQQNTSEIVDKLKMECSDEFNDNLVKINMRDTVYTEVRSVKSTKNDDNYCSSDIQVKHLHNVQQLIEYYRVWKIVLDSKFFNHDLEK